MYRARILVGVILTASIAVLSGCHPGLIGEWQRVNPEDIHEFMDESIVFTETEVYYFGTFGGPNDLMPAGKHDDAPLYPMFQGTYTVNIWASPKTIDFDWLRYWPGEHEDESFEPFRQLGIWDRQTLGHGNHSHITLWVNFGDEEERPEDWHGEIRFELMDDHDHDK